MIEVVQDQFSAIREFILDEFDRDGTKMMRCSCSYCGTIFEVRTCKLAGRSRRKVYCGAICGRKDAKIQKLIGSNDSQERFNLVKERLNSD